MKLIPFYVVIIFFSFINKIQSYQAFFLQKEKHTTVEITSEDKSLDIIISDEVGKRVKIYIESLDNDYTISKAAYSVLDEDDIKQDGKKAEIKYNVENYQVTFELYIEVKQDTKFDIYYTTVVKTSTIIIIILVIIVVLAVLFGGYKFYKYADKETKKNQENLLNEKEEKNQKKECIKQLYEIIRKNPYMINFICPFCFRDRNGKKVCGEEDDEDKEDIGILNDEAYPEPDTSEEYKKEFIEQIKNGTINKIGLYTKVDDNCRHFYHDKCINKHKAKNKKFECLFCKDNITPNNIKVFCELSETVLNNIVGHHYLKVCFYSSKDLPYNQALLDAVYSFASNCPDLNDEIKNKIKESRRLAKKFIKNYLKDKDYEIGINDNFEFYEKKFEEELEEKNERRKENAARREEEARNNRQNRSNESKNNIEMTSKSSVKEERVNTLCCQDCYGHCAFCRATTQKAGKLYAHKSCYKEKTCVICNNKKGVHSVVATCNKCKSSHKDVYSNYYCFFCHSSC